MWLWLLPGFSLSAGWSRADEMGWMNCIVRHLLQTGQVRHALRSRQWGSSPPKPFEIHPRLYVHFYLLLTPFTQQYFGSKSKVFPQIRKCLISCLEFRCTVLGSSRFGVKLSYVKNGGETIFSARALPQEEKKEICR